MKGKHSHLFVIVICWISITPIRGMLLGNLTTANISSVSESETTFFAQLGNGGGLKSEIVLTNPSSSDTTVGRLEFYDDEGDTLDIGFLVAETESSTFLIQSNGTSSVSGIEFSISPLGSLTLATDGLGALKVGSAIVFSTQPIGGVIRFTIDGVGIAGVGTSQGLESFIVPVTRKQYGLNIGIALLNIGPTPVSVILSLNNQNGEPVFSESTSMVDLPPLGHTAKFISELFPETGEFVGTVTGTVSGGEVAATAVELGAYPGEFTTLPVTPTDNFFGQETLSLEDGSFVCRPKGIGPFPIVLHSHGGKGDDIGGDLKGTCESLAEAGCLARSEKRRETISLDGHLEDVAHGLSELLSHPDADDSKVTLLGFSRGGLLTLQAAVESPNQIHSIVLMAPAPGGNNDLQATLENVAPLEANALLMVAENDLPPAQLNDHVQLLKGIDSSLRMAGKTVTMILYPPFSSDGHELFFEVREPYWSNILAFLKTENSL